MMVYVVFSGEYDDEEIEGIYSTEEKAKSAADGCPKARGAWVWGEPFELDGPTIHKKREPK